MKKFGKLSLNKILIIATVVLVVIAIIAVALYLSLKNTKEEINYEDTVIAKNYFSKITIDLEKRIVKRDDETTTIKEEFDINEETEALILSSENELRKFFLEG